jgi:hypothetical protein
VRCGVPEATFLPLVEDSEGGARLLREMLNENPAWILEASL